MIGFIMQHRQQVAHGPLIELRYHLSDKPCICFGVYLAYLSAEGDVLPIKANARVGNDITDSYVHITSVQINICMHVHTNH